MGLFECTFYSDSLSRTITMNAIIPTDKTMFTQHEQRDIKEYKALYLLHGGLGSHVDWIGGTNIQRWAQDKDLMVFMPSGENLFYIDIPETQGRFGKFIGEELVEYTRKTFPLSHKREDTFIAGLSMGGYGALVNGLKYNHTFGYIGSLSAGVLIDGIVDEAPKITALSPKYLEDRSFWTRIFGDLSKLRGSDKDYKALAQKVMAEKGDIPKIFMCCGTEDFLLPENQEYRDFLRGINYPVDWFEGPGSHDWDFWDTFIKKFIDWLPLGEAKPGISSGHTYE